MAIPEGFEGQVRPRSGLAIRNGIGVVNGPGTIDADYRGEIGVVLINFGNEPFTVRDGDRIAQMVISRVFRAVWEEVDDLPLYRETRRGVRPHGPLRRVRKRRGNPFRQRFSALCFFFPLTSSVNDVGSISSLPHRGKGLSENTIEAYHHDLSRFLDHLREKGIQDISRVDKLNLRAFLARLETAGTFDQDHCQKSGCASNLFPFFGSGRNPGDQPCRGFGIAENR